MQNSNIFSYKSLCEPYELSWRDISSSSYDEAGMYGPPLSCTSYDDTYYLTYEEVGDCNRGVKRGGYKGYETPVDISGTCLGYYTRYLCSYLGEETDGESSFEINRKDDHKWVGYFGDDSNDFKYSNRCDYWEETMSLYQSIFGH